jgi:hypothetical protein
MRQRSYKKMIIRWGIFPKITAANGLLQHFCGLRG